MNPPGITLFVGNSLTYRGGGIDHHYSRLVPEARTERIVRGGATLAQHRTAVETRLENGDIGTLILQDDLPETTVDAFLESAEFYAPLARDAGAVPWLLMTWPYSRLDWIDTRGIADAHHQATAATGIPTIPAGLAWEDFRLNRREPNLYDSDGEHPSVAGAFLAACCVAAALGHPLPADSYVPESLSPEDADTLRSVAVSMVDGDRGSGSPR